MESESETWNDLFAIRIRISIRIRIRNRIRIRIRIRICISSPDFHIGLSRGITIVMDSHAILTMLMLV